jgi:hypothetical protein
MSGVTGAIIGGSVIAAGAGIAGGAMQSSAARKANRTNQAIADEQNRLNYEMFLQSRGSEGSSILPFYFAQEGQTPYEQTLAENAMAAASMLPSAAQQQAQARSLQTRFQPTIDAATGAVEGIFDDSLLREEQELLLPVEQERMAAVQTRRQAGFEALRNTLNEINALQAGRGFSGDSSASNQLRANTRRQIATDAATAESAARLQNAGDRRSLGMANINRRVANVNLPLQVVEQNRPATAALANEQQRQGAFNWFRLGPQAFQNQRAPLVQPVAGTGQYIAGAVGGAAGSLANLAASQYISNNIYGQGNQGYYPGTVNVGGADLQGLTPDQINLLFQ